MPAHPDAVLEEGRQDSTEAKPQRGSLPTELRGRLPTRGSLLNMWHRSNTDADSTTSVCGNSAPWCSFIRLFVHSLARSLVLSLVQYTPSNPQTRCPMSWPCLLRSTHVRSQALPFKCFSACLSGSRPKHKSCARTC